MKHINRILSKERRIRMEEMHVAEALEAVKQATDVVTDVAQNVTKSGITLSKPAAIGLGAAGFGGGVMLGFGLFKYAGKFIKGGIKAIRGEDDDEEVFTRKSSRKATSKKKKEPVKAEEKAEDENIGAFKRKPEETED